MNAGFETRIWTALPIPGVLVDGANRVVGLNPVAEGFLGDTEKSLRLISLCDCLQADVSIDSDIDRARAGQSVVFHHDVTVTIGRRPPARYDVHVAPLGDGGETMLVLFYPGQIKGRLGKALKSRSAAKTAIGLADMLAHEIKNPLAGITGAAQLLSMTLDPKDREMTDLILQETRRILALLSQVEQFGDLRPPKMHRVNIHDALERARRSAALGVARRMSFHDLYDPSLPPTLGDGDQLQQVFANLFANAAEAAGGRAGQITIRTFYEQGLRLESGAGGRALPLQIEISDDGPGIDESLLDSVFDPFVSGRENGTGLGLALVSKIISEHGGAITVTSRPGRTAFRISLPRAPRGAETEKGQD